MGGGAQRGAGPRGPLIGTMIAAVNQVRRLQVFGCSGVQVFGPDAPEDLKT